MTLSNPISDFSRNTLGSLHCLWAKLGYLVSLRDEQGDYHHWGMEHKYGEDSAREAIRTVHRQVVNDLLRQPTSAVWEELTAELREPALTDLDYEALLKEGKALLPKGSTRAAQEHFTLLVHVMQAFRSRSATDRAA